MVVGALITWEHVADTTVADGSRELKPGDRHQANAFNVYTFSRLSETIKL